MSENLHDTLTSAFVEEADRKRRASDGQVHPFFSWVPQTSRYIGDDAIWWDDVDEETGIVTRRDGLEFQETLPTSKAFMVGAITATGTGKTDWLAEMAVACLIGYHPCFPEVRWDEPQVIYFGTEARTIKPIFKRIVRQMPDGFGAKVKESRGYERIEMPSGASLQMMSYSLDRTAWQAEQLNKLFLDEEPGSGFWFEAQRRLRRPDSQVFIGCTTLKGSTFVHEQFEKFPPSARNAQSGMFAWSSAPMYANPKLPKEYIDRQKWLYRNDKDLYEICVEGKPKSLRTRFIFTGTAMEKAQDGAEPPATHVRVTSADRVIETDLDDQWAIFRKPVPLHRYVLAADLSEGGLEGDYTAVQGIDCDTGEQVCRFQGRVEPGPFTVELVALAKHFNDATVNYEKNMQGAAVFDRLRQMGYPRVAKTTLFADQGQKRRTDFQQYGFRTDKKTKQIVVWGLRDAFFDGHIKVYDELTLDELGRFGWLRKEDTERRKDHGMGAISGHDDLVMALAIAWWTARQTPPVAPIKPEERTIIEKMWDQFVANKGRSPLRSAGPGVVY